MASKFKIGDLVWAKLKGFPAWPGKVIEPKGDKKISSRAKKQYVFFYGSENYAWIPEETIWSFIPNKEKFNMTSRIPKGFKEAVEAIEDVIKKLPAAQPTIKKSNLPSIEDEIATIFPEKKESAKTDDQKVIERRPLKTTGKRKKLLKANVKAAQDESKVTSPASNTKRPSTTTRKRQRASKPSRKQAARKTTKPKAADNAMFTSEASSSDDNFTRVRESKVIGRLEVLPLTVKQEDELRNISVSEHVKIKRRASAESSSLDAKPAPLKHKRSKSDGVLPSIKKSPYLTTDSDDCHTKQVNDTNSVALAIGDETETDCNVDTSEKETETNEKSSDQENIPPTNSFMKLEQANIMTPVDDIEASPKLLRTPGEDIRTYSRVRKFVERFHMAASQPGTDSKDVCLDLRPKEREEQSHERVDPPPVEKKEKKDRRPSTPRSVPRKRPSSTPSPHSASSKKSRLLKASPRGGAVYNSYEKGVASSTVTASASSTSRDHGWNSNNTFRKDSPLFERYDRVLDPSMVEPILSKSIIPTPLKIGFLGLGIMGSGMVSNLLRSGHEVTVWNRTPSKCKEFIKEGALKGNSPAEVVQLCDITLSSVADPTALKDLVFGNCGVLQGVTQGKAYVDMSTVDVETITDVHEAVTARGGRFLEAPVIGSKSPASHGNLLILAAGDRTLYDDCYSCFEAMGKRTFYLGEIGSAAKMKLVLNLLMGTVVAGLAESLALAEKVGLDQEEVLQILDLSPVSCPLIKAKGNAMISNNYSDPHCKLHTCQKDLRLSVNMSDTVDQPLHVGAAVNELFKKAKAKGYGEHDTAAVYRAADL